MPPVRLSYSDKLFTMGSPVNLAQQPPPRRCAALQLRDL